jgi:hypothetical protein
VEKYVRELIDVKAASKSAIKSSPVQSPMVKRERVLELR